MFRFAAIVTAIELVLTAGASILVSYTEAPPAFATEADLNGLGIPFASLETDRRMIQGALAYETRATLSSPPAELYVSLRTKASAADCDFRRAREESPSATPDRGEVTVINEPLPGEKGYAVRHRAASFVRFELVRLKGDELFIVRVKRALPFDLPIAAELSRCERRARIVQEHVMTKMRWRD
jgi:hypothetical protein